MKNNTEGTAHRPASRAFQSSDDNRTRILHHTVNLAQKATDADTPNPFREFQ